MNTLLALSVRLSQLEIALRSSAMCLIFLSLSLSFGAPSVQLLSRLRSSYVFAIIFLLTLYVYFIFFLLTSPCDFLHSTPFRLCLDAKTSFAKPLTVRNALLWYSDITNVPRKAFVSALAQVWILCRPAVSTLCLLTKRHCVCCRSISFTCLCGSQLVPTKSRRTRSAVFWRIMIWPIDAAVVFAF